LRALRGLFSKGTMSVSGCGRGITTFPRNIMPKKVTFSRLSRKSREALSKCSTDHWRGHQPEFGNAEL
ncbi:MAG TPA: hypothetical protein VFM05_02050, partial [Candidatus Saccharimonadales bacterium]|nr:hypothetical protein [Candidatus Saccharimonadales bacterium]